MASGKDDIIDKLMKETKEELADEQPEFRIHWPKRNLKRVFNIAFPFLNISLAVLVIWIGMNQGEVTLYDIRGVNINWWWVVAGMGLYYLMVANESVRLGIVMKKMTGHRKLGLSTKMYVLERFYSLLTPLSSGGRPYQIYYLHKHGYKFTDSSSTVFSHYIIGRIGFQIASGLCIVLLFHQLGNLDGGGIVTSAIIFGIVFNVGVTIVTLFLVFNRAITEKVANIGICILYKLHLIKHKKNSINHTRDMIWQFRQNVRRVMRDKVTTATAVLMAVFSYTTYISIIMFVYASLWGWSWSVAPILLLGIALTEYISSFVPLPGGTGGMEFFFLSVFASVFGSPQILVALVLWRIITFMLPIVNGLPIILFDSFKFNMKKTSMPESETIQHSE